MTNERTNNIWSVYRAVLLLIPPLIFFTDLTRNPYYVQIVLLQALVVLPFLYYLFKLFRQPAVVLEIKLTPLDLPLLLFYLWTIISWLINLSGVWPNEYWRWSAYSEGLKRFLFNISNVLLVYYLAFYFVKKEEYHRVIHLTFWAGFIAAAYGILQYFYIEPIWPRVLNPFGGRSVSTFGNPNFMSSYLIMLLPLLFIYYLRAEKSSSRRLYFIMMLTYLGSVICTLTRSSWLGLLGEMVIVGMFLPKELLARKKNILLPLAIAAVLIVFFWPHNINISEKYSSAVARRIQETTEMVKTVYAPSHQRLLIWSCAWMMVKDFPVYGRGWGLFELFYPLYQARCLFLPQYRGLRTHANNAHDEILEIVSQTGIVGLGLYLLYIVVIFIVWKKLVQQKNDWEQNLAVALGASVFGMLLDNSVNVSLYFAVPAFLYWWHLGLLMQLGQWPKKKIVLANWSRLIILLLMIGGILLVRRYWRNFLGEINYFTGFKLSKSNQVQFARQYLEKAHRYQRLEVNNNYELGNTYARLGMLPEAIWAYEEALRANSGYDEIYFNLATVYSQMKNIPKAIDNYTGSLRINPLSREAYGALGNIFLSQPEYLNDKVEKFFQQSVYFYPENKDFWNNLGYFYVRTGNPGAAQGAFHQALAIDPDFTVARRNLANVLKQLGKSDKEIIRAEELNQKIQEAVRAQNWPQALSLAQELKKLEPDSIRANFYLANLLFTSGRFSEAATIYQEILQKHPENIVVRTNLALLYTELKQENLARQEWEKILALDPGNETARKHLGRK